MLSFTSPFRLRFWIGCFIIGFLPQVNAQVMVKDSTYLPPISITSANGFGPYVINSQRSNLFLVYDLPQKTSSITMRFLDIDGKQINSAYVKVGSDLQDAYWMLESDTMGFPLSPFLDILIKYQGDSIAEYKIPYEVYPDTVNFYASAGWGPFITNNYPRTDTSWHNVPEQLNTFTVSNLPPRTDSVVLEIISADSAVLVSAMCHAQAGHYLDSVAFENVRMDMLPLSARLLQAVIYCNGGPVNGLLIHKTMTLVPQEPKLTYRHKGLVLHDSIGVFMEEQKAGQALQVDSVRHARITNGPGDRMYYGYQGPYSLDGLKGAFTLEAWLKLDLAKIHSHAGNESYIIAVDTAFALSFVSEPDGVTVSIRYHYCLPNDCIEIYRTAFPLSQLGNSPWHHLAITFDGTFNPDARFYLDGVYQPTTIYHDEINYILLNNPSYVENLITRPLFIGGRTPEFYGFISAVDEFRVWNRARSQEEIAANMKRQVLQDNHLIGYWNFDDRRNRLDYISDLSFKNNTGRLVNGASFIPQDMSVESTLDTITIISSHAQADSIRFSFLDNNDEVCYAGLLQASNSRADIYYDMESLPFTVNRLRISEYFPDAPDQGFITDYSMQGMAPTPVATPLYNWNTFYHSANNIGSINNRIVVSNFPKNTSKVELGLTNGSQLFGVAEYNQNSIPYRYSLRFNGVDNYITTSQLLNGPQSFTISLWFKTTTTQGGKLIGFCDSQNGITQGDHDREILLEPDGAIRFVLRNQGVSYILTAANKYNDGEWHQVTAVKYGNEATLSVDGSLVDMNNTVLSNAYQGYWVLARNDGSYSPGMKAIANYFDGYICEVSVTYSSGAPGGSVDPTQQHKGKSPLRYKFDEGSGTTIHDSGGSNTGTLHGGFPAWVTCHSLSMLSWNQNMINIPPGSYTFYARAYYPGGPQEGANYPLGVFMVADPLPGFFFQYYLTNGIGYFNEGTALSNSLYFATDFTQQSAPNWKDNFLKYKFLSPGHEVIDSDMVTWTVSGYSASLSMDMGDAPPGSYLSVELGYHEADNLENVTNFYAIPVYINPMLAPTVRGNFGPFDQAIAPGTMKAENTFIIATEIISDLNKVTGRFYDQNETQLGSADAVKITDTTWHLTFDMSILSPPLSLLKIEYFLGQNLHLALVQGPFEITIHKTRPRWFDFLADTSFHNISEAGDNVLFSLITPFEQSYVINNSSNVSIPGWIPLLGGISSELKSPTAQAYLKYNKPAHKLDFSQPPDFFQKIFHIGAGSAKTLKLGFNYSQNNSYSLDASNDLIASQNFSMGGSAESEFEKLEGIVTKVKKLMTITKIVDVESAVISPSFGLSATGSFEYSSRLHLITDTTSGDWGSFGNLDVDANPQHAQAFANSSSYHFYSGGLEMEFYIGVKLLEGLVEGDLGIDGRILLGFGHSYNSIPSFQTKPLHSLAFQSYGRFWISVFWGWIQRNIWGPQLFYNTTLWGDDMTNAFPPVKKDIQPLKVLPANPSLQDLSPSIYPVSGFTKDPLPHPQPSVKLRSGNRIFAWLEPGKILGERHLRIRNFDVFRGEFGDACTVATNRNAICYPSADMIDDRTVFVAWTQSRHQPETIENMKTSELLSAFAMSQDIWYSVYDVKDHKPLVCERVDDLLTGLQSGRAEGIPDVTVLSDDRVLITWQVADLVNHESDLWYCFVNKSDGQWVASDPSLLSKETGIETNALVESPAENIAVAVWQNRVDPLHEGSQLLYSLFNGSYWSEPAAIMPGKGITNINYYDMDFENGLGGLVWSEYSRTKAKGSCETLSMLPWDPLHMTWSIGAPVVLLSDSIRHLLLPRIVINETGTAAISCKPEVIGVVDPSVRISGLELFTGKINDINSGWRHLSASDLVCDTTKQVRDVELTFGGIDTLIVLSHEHIMSATNMHYTPVNGLIFGDPYMNLVIRAVFIDKEGEIIDVDENQLFPGGNDTLIHRPELEIGQNYPNPCDAFTHVDLYIPSTGNVRMEILDAEGSLVAVPFDQTLPAGPYTVKLNTAVFRKGVYFCRIIAFGKSISNKMIVAH